MKSIRDGHILAQSSLPLMSCKLGLQMLIILTMAFLATEAIAQKFIYAAEPPGSATLVSPSGNITTSTPIYTWNAVPTATWYQLWVSDASASPKILQWYTTEQSGCASGTGTCTVTPSVALVPGACRWWIQTYNSVGLGPWSNALSFTVNLVIPGKATLISPSGAISVANPTYTWNAVSTATWYQLWVADSSGSPKIRAWYTPTDAGCVSGTGTCSVTPTTKLTPGQCQWWIQTWNAGGDGPWSDGMAFSLGGISSRRIILLKRNVSDSTVDYFRSLLSSNGYAFTELGASQLNSANLENTVIIAGFASVPEEYTSFGTIIKNAISAGSWVLTEGLGQYLLTYAGIGKTATGTWSPITNLVYAFVNKINDSPLFNGIPVWDPPSKPDQSAQYLARLIRTGSRTVWNYIPPLSGLTLIYSWNLQITYGWNGLPTDSIYCQSWGGCTGDRDVVERPIKLISHGTGKILAPMNAIPHLENDYEYGPVAAAIYRNFIDWALKN